MAGMAEEADGVGDVATVLQLIKLGEDRRLSRDEINELGRAVGGPEPGRTRRVHCQGARAPLRVQRSRPSIA